MTDVPIDPIGAARRLDTILGRTDLPYTYTDPDTGAVLTVDPAGDIQIMSGESGHYCAIPSGEDAPALARAILTAVGNTGHMVISRDELTAMRRADARSMRERASDAAETARSPERAALAIRALPLLPDTTDDTTEAPARYRDRDGDLWEETSPGHLFLSTRGMTGRPYAVVADEFGPLTPVTT